MTRENALSEYEASSQQLDTITVTERHLKETEKRLGNNMSLRDESNDIFIKTKLPGTESYSAHLHAPEELKETENDNSRNKISLQNESNDLFFKTSMASIQGETYRSQSYGAENTSKLPDISNQSELTGGVESSKRTCEACTRSKVKCSGPPTCLRCLKTDQKCIFRQKFKRGRKRKYSADSSSSFSRNSLNYDSSSAMNQIRMSGLQDTSLNQIPSLRMCENFDKCDSMIELSQLLDRNRPQSSTWYLYESLVQVSFERCPLCKLPVLANLGKSNQPCSACMTTI